MSAIEIQPINFKKKRILIIMSEGGGGHKVASYAMQNILSADYDIEIINALSQLMKKIDYFTLLTSGAFSGDDFYNFLLRRGYHRAVSVLAHFGLKYMLAQKHKICELVTKYLKEAPIPYDMIISTIPYVNCGVALAAQQLQIPFIIMPTDLDTVTFFSGLTEIDFSLGNKFAFALPYDDQDIKKKALGKYPFLKDKIHITGFPIRQECMQKFSDQQIKLMQCKHGLRNDSFVLTMLLGAGGSSLLEEYSLEIFRIDPHEFTKPIEVNICVGRYEKMQRIIMNHFISQGGKLLRENPLCITMKSPQGAIFHIRKFMSDIVELMACSSLIITKTGSCTVNEGIYLGRKLLLDNTENSSARYLQWENFNVPFVRKHGLGDAFTELKELNPMIKFLLQEDLGHPVHSGAFSVPNFSIKLHQLIQEMIN